MEESVTYQAIIRKGEILGERKLIQRVGRQRFGAPDAAAEGTLAAIDDRDRLERIADRLFDAASWADLLATP
jgi:hypothetical protein